MKLKLQTDAERDLDELRSRLEMEKQTASTYTIERRKRELQQQKDDNIKGAKSLLMNDMRNK